MSTPDIRDLNRRAVDYSVEIVSHLTPDHLERPTPCAAWTVADLLAHMTVQHRGFAAAARGNGADLDVWKARPLAADPVRDYADAAAEVTAAYDRPDILERIFDLPEFGTGARAPGSMALRAHFIDYVVHGWDIARALDVPYRLADDFVEPALEITGMVPTGGARAASSAFAAELPVTPDATPLDHILAHLGRNPSWPH
ncbi:TIGR03086 family metal-binding protein [Nocardia miyunensis]|uniref:TIGR03086 family metal-binding protein n=1 Tax=Nocardia miyunensis TaxID=282684 RepID=UPI00082CE4F1|nr:TIGR03086 family metal-binding protein [Nocardia miyunensis]